MRSSFRKIFFSFIVVFFLVSVLWFNDARSQQPGSPSGLNDFSSDADYNETVQFFVEVFKVMQQNYYKEIDSTDLKKFVYIFNTQLYPKMRQTQKSKKYVKWRSAAYLVDALKEEEDIFSKLFPPKDAKKYETTVLGKRIDLGIDGELGDQGYLVTWVEPRSDAHEKGLRKDDIIYQIDKTKILTLREEEIRKLLVPLADETVVLKYIDHQTSRRHKIKVISEEYFKQLAFMVPTGVESVFCIQIKRFNRKTGEDVTSFIEEILAYPGEAGLIIDLRGNPGGPPLAAREISSFFLKPGEEFAFFQKRMRPKSSLDVPEVPEKYHYKGDMVILINEKSGSASELFSGILQGKGRAELMGLNSAGQVFLKSMFYMSDGSMVLLITARGHHSDGKVFSFDGLDPDVRVENSDQDLIRYAADYLLKKRQQILN